MIQTLASTMLIFSLSILERGFNLTLRINFYSSLTLLQSAIFIKLGIAPFHFWFPEVIEGLSWSSRFLLLTWQKTAPMSILIIVITTRKTLIIARIVFSSIVGRIIGLNQIRLRKILSYSSIRHIAWIVIRIIYSINIWLIYFIVYSLTNFNLIFIFKKIKTFRILQLRSSNLNFIRKLILLFNLISLAGLPPLIGFLPKWLIISKIIFYSQILIPTIVIISTLIAIFFYLQISFPILFIKNKKIKFKLHKPSFNSMFLILNLIFLFSLFFSSLLF